jgi:hypothetical protein
MKISIGGLFFFGRSEFLALGGGQEGTGVIGVEARRYSWRTANIVTIGSLTLACCLLSLTGCASAPGQALSPGLAGDYVLIHRAGHPTDFTFRLWQSSGQWQIDVPVSGGAWRAVTCPGRCQLQPSTASEVSRFLGAGAAGSHACVHNQSFAFCASTEIGGLAQLVVPTRAQPVRLEVRRLVVAADKAM